jgi:hypothetical protein
VFGTIPEREVQALASDDEPGEDTANNIRAALAAARARRLQPDNDEAPTPDNESISRAAQELTARPAPSPPSPIPISHTSEINQASTSLANPGRAVSASTQDRALVGRSTSTPASAAANAPGSEDILVETATGKKKGGSTGTAKGKKPKPVGSDATTRKSTRKRV